MLFLHSPHMDTTDCYLYFIPTSTTAREYCTDNDVIYVIVTGDMGSTGTSMGCDRGCDMGCDTAESMTVNGVMGSTDNSMGCDRGCGRDCDMDCDTAESSGRKTESTGTSISSSPVT